MGPVTVESTLHLDHVIVFVGDLRAATDVMAAASLRISSTAIHPGVGTRNAVARFEFGFIELLAERDREEMLETRYGRWFRERADLMGWGPVVYVLRTGSFDELRQECRERGGEFEDTMIGYVQRPSGETASWEAGFMPGTEPTFIDPRLPVVGRESAAQRPSGGIHDMPATGLAGVVLGVNSVNETSDLLKRQLGLSVATTDASSAEAVLSKTGQWLAVREAAGAQDPLARSLRSRGEGVVGIGLWVDPAAPGVIPDSDAGSPLSGPWLRSVWVGEPVNLWLVLVAGDEPVGSAPDE